MVHELKTVYEDCLKRILRPVVRFCVRRSIPVQYFLELSKILYLESTARELEKQGLKVNVSRLSVSTGLHRRDVVRLYRDKETPKSSASFSSRVIGQWEQDPRFTTKANKPRVLSYEGEDSEFRELVSLISTDVNPGTVLFELERIGAIRKTSRGLKLLEKRHVIVKDPGESFSLLERDSDDLIQTVSENTLSDPKVRHLHARTEYDNISHDDLENIKLWLLKEGTAFHTKVRKYLSQFDQDVNPRKNKTGGARVVVGTFSRSEGEES